MAINLIAPRQFFTIPSWVPHPPDKTDVDSSTEPSETTFFPPPESTVADDEGDHPAPTMGNEPESSLIMEESTITNGLTTRTDSGRTVTVPNDEIVTVTRHTTIVTDKPPPLPTAPTETAPPLPSPPIGESSPPVLPTESESTEETQSGGPLPTGALVGVGVSGAALVAFIVIMVIMIKRRLKKRHEEDLASTRNDDDFGREDREEKYFPQQMSAHTTGNTQGSGDPFAPFGGGCSAQQKEILFIKLTEIGRVDVNSEYPYRPANNTFEMDATPLAPVELPDTAVIRPSTAPDPSSPHSPPMPVHTPNTDPRANLDTVADEDGNPKYINHWNQYRAVGSN